MARVGSFRLGYFWCGRASCFLWWVRVEGVLCVLIYTVFSFSSYGEGIGVHRVTMDSSLFRMVTVSPSSVGQGRPFGVSAVIRGVRCIPLRATSAILVKGVGGLVI